MKNTTWVSRVTLSVFGLGIFSSTAIADENSFSFNAEGVFIGDLTNEIGLASSQNFTSEIGVGVEKKHYFDNGAILGFAGELRLQKDNEARQGFAGEIQISDLLSGLSPELAEVHSPTTGISISDRLSNDDPYGSIQSAYMNVKFGWGEVSVGRDIGAAVRLDARPPKVLRYGSLNSPRLNSISSSVVRARNDVTGPSAKISYISPRILGLRVGASFTPESDARGIDFDSRRTGLKNVYEAGVSYSHYFRDSDVRLRLGLTSTFADMDLENAIFQDYEAIGAGIEIEKGNWKSGLRYLSSNNSVAAGGGDYSALEVGVSRSIEDWTFAAEYGSAKDDLLALKGTNWAVGASIALNKNVNLGISYFSSESKIATEKLGGDGLQFELIVRYE